MDTRTAASTPGPGRYNSNNIDYTRTKSPSVTLKGKPKISYDNFNPGPGQYELNSSTISNKNKGSGGVGSWNKSKRDFRISHTVHSTINLDTGKDSNGTLTPGPGRYTVKSDFDSKNPKGYKMPSDKRRISEPLNNNPGVGEYTSMDKISAFKSDKSAKGFEFSKTKKSDNPFLSQSLNGNVKELDTIPGPGRYNSNSDNKVKSFQFGIKTPVNYDNRIPGPGSYDGNPVTTKGKTPGGVHSKSSRGELFSTQKSVISPGPGRYKQDVGSISSNSLKGGVFSKDKKLKDINSGTPGPGAYRVNCSVRDINEYSKTGGKFSDEFKYV